MNRIPKTLAGLFLLCVIVIPSPLLPAETCHRVVAVVNNEVITQYELERKIREVTGFSADGLKTNIDPMAGPVMDEFGQPVMMPVPNLHDVEFRQIRSSGCAKLAVLPPERCLVSERCKSMSLQDAPFFEFWEFKTISELREMGFDVPDNLADDGGTELGVADLARDYGKSMSLYERDLGNDPSMRRVRVRMVWIRHDYNQDGIAELLQCIVVGGEILQMDEVDTIPVACIVPTPVPHRHVGVSIADVVMDLQEIRSGMLRQIVDNTYLQNNGRYGISNKVSLHDFLTSRPLLMLQNSFYLYLVFLRNPY